jgi:two-component system LytT family response regulator
VKIRTLIVDDEPLARQRVRKLLEADSDIAILGECSDGKQAVAELQRLRPDLVFLDVQMPVLDGFGVLQSLVGTDLPVVIFVTAHDRYALKAFEVHALDYLLKPFDKARFSAALERAKAQVRQGSAVALEDRLEKLLQTLAPSHPQPLVYKGRGATESPTPQAAKPDAGRRLERLMVKSDGRIYFVRIDDVDWIEAAGNYVRLHVGKENHLLRETLTALEKKLDPARFVRIHRSTVVNLERIRELQPVFHGDYVIVLRDGQELAVSRGFRDNLKEALGHAP